MVLKQAGRLGKLHTSLGPDVLVLLRFNGTDQMNGLFNYQVEALSAQRDIDFDALVGTHATVEIATHHGTPSFFDGVVTQAQWAGVGENGNKFNLTLRPWFWLATNRRNQKIFHNQTVIDIAKAILGPYLSAGAELKVLTTATYPALEYTVQYRESDFTFVTRLLERFGISYHFTHDKAKHALVLTDGIDEHDDVPGGSRAFIGSVGHHQYGEEHFWEFQPERRITTGGVRLIDYNFKKPTAAMEVDKMGDAAHGHGQIESFDYPGDYLEQSAGKGVVGLRTRQERGNDARARAVGDTISLSAGLKVTLKGEPIPGATGQTFLCLSAIHSYVSDSYGSGGDTSTEFSYAGRYTLMPATSPMAPDRKTTPPVVQGPQTATVVGEGEIDCDSFGRILVKFHWDLDSAHSMRCRVSQMWAGQGWGGMAIPRIGMEVIVEFLEGDPDKPVVTGCVYNGKNGAPYDLPANKTRTVWRSNTHQGSGHNEISFEDEAGKEDLFFHAQKDMTQKVLNNMSTNVQANRVSTIGQNDTTTVTGSHVVRVGKSSSTTIGGGGPALLKALQPLVAAGGKMFKEGANKVGAPGIVTEFAGVVQGVADMAKEVAQVVTKGDFFGSAGHRSDAGGLQAKAAAFAAGLLDKVMPDSGTMTNTVEKFRSETTGLAATEQVGIAKNTVVGGVYTIGVGKMMKTVVGDSIDIEAKGSIFARTKKHTLHAKEKFVIAGPGGSITIDSSGITIKTPHLMVKSPSVDFSSGSPDQVDALKSDKPFVQECKGK
ncbi:MAG: type VI secretion system tip protein VgrG [Rhodobacteraceae bacterium]|jgi:type VI secretion system secreted protein VgrG|nr:type VI secretion system tip protein VgrG [Paracoccaceae bacterium]